MIDVQRLTLGDNAFTYRVCGVGPDVLLIHGWISSGHMWEGLMQELAPLFRVWALDLIGFGDSRNANSSHSLTVDDHVELVVAFCHALDIHPYAVIGHSMGGAIALKLALDYPAMLEKLVLVSPVVTGRFGASKDLLLGSRFGRILLRQSQHLWPIALRLSRLGAELAVPYLKGQRRSATLNGLHKATWAGAHSALTSMINIRLDQRLHEVCIPALIITGSLDNVVPPTDSRTAASLIADSQLLEWPHLHHHTPDEDPERF